MSLIEQQKASRARVKHRKSGKALAPEGLTTRHLEIIKLMVYGTTGKAMTAAQVSEHMGLRPGYTHSLLSEPVFAVEYAKAYSAKRIAARPHGLDRLLELKDSDNEPVALGASKALIDEPNKAGGVNVNVGVSVNQQTNVSYKPGYVIRLPAEIGESAKGPPIIEGTVNDE